MSLLNSGSLRNPPAARRYQNNMEVAAAWAGNTCLGCDEAADGFNYCSEQCRMQSQQAVAVSPEPRTSTSTTSASKTMCRYSTVIEAAALSPQAQDHSDCRSRNSLYLSESYGSGQQSRSSSSSTQCSDISSQSQHIFSPVSDAKTSQTTKSDTSKQQSEKSRSTRRMTYPATFSPITRPCGDYNRTSGISPYDRTSTIGWCTEWRPHNSALIEVADNF